MPLCKNLEELIVEDLLQEIVKIKHPRRTLIKPMLINEYPYSEIIFRVGSLKHYTGIGSRETPEEIIQLMRRIAACLSQEGWSCRTGGAKGADTAFEIGSCEGTNENSITQVFYANGMVREWRLFNNKWANYTSEISKNSWSIAGSIAKQNHPAWTNLRPYFKNLMTRNVFQVLGIPHLEESHTEYLDVRTVTGRAKSILTSYSPTKIKIEPSSFVVCWTADGAVENTTRKTGGTGQAIRIANQFNIPVFNLQRPEHRERLEIWVENQMEARMMRTAEAAFNI